MKLKVLISDKMDPRCAEILQQGPGIQVDVQTDLDHEGLKAIIGEYEGLIVRSSTQVNEEILQAGHRLKVVGRAGIGVDNIDAQAATRHGVIVMNTPGGNSLSTAEHSFAMLMALARNIPQATASIRAGEWDKSRFTGTEMAGKTLGVLGLGKVGREVALRGSAFRMKVLTYDPYLSEEIALEYGAQLCQLDEILEKADFITVHLPLTAQTRYLIGEEQLARCKDGLYVINCARGGLVDEAALLQALESGKVAGAALDVFEQEPPEFGALTSHERVICTPHLAASTREAQANVALQVAQQVGDALAGRVIRNAVNVPSIEQEAYQKMRPFLDLAERLGKLQAQLGEGQLERITIEYHGDISAQATAPLTSAVLKGIMSIVSGSGSVNEVNAPVFAQERGIQVDELRSSEHEDYAALITVAYQTSQGRRILSGTIFGKNDLRLVRLDDYTFDAVPEGHMLFYLNDDVPGVIGRIGTAMGRHQVNIAQMACGRRKEEGRALTIINVDSLVPEELIEEILSQDYISWVKQVSLS